MACSPRWPAGPVHTAPPLLAYLLARLGLRSAYPAAGYRILVKADEMAPSHWAFLDAFTW